MRIITYKELGEYIGKQASEYFDKWYSYDIKDYEDDFYKDNRDTVYNADGSVIDKWECHIEIARVGVPPLIIDWLEVYYYDNMNDYEYCNYSNVEYLV